MNDDRLLRPGLAVAIAVPFLYFGTQIVALPFFPGYDMVAKVASELGSPKSSFPILFNVLVVVTGLAQLVAAFAIPRGLARLEAWPWITWVIGLMLGLGAIGTIKAGIFPLPHPLHGNLGFLATALMLFPPLLLAAVWPREDADKLKIYLGASAALTLAMIPILSGGLGIDAQPIKGLLQRIFALAVFPPIGVGAVWISRRLRDTGGGVPPAYF